MKNNRVSKLLHRIADLLELKNAKFKVRAYKNAARTIQDMPKDIEQAYQDGELTNIPSVGKSIADKISEYLETGSIQYYEKLKKCLPIDIEGITSLEGIGSKTAKKLYDELGVKDVDDLRKVAESGQIASLKGFGKRSQQKILESLKRSNKMADRFLLGRIEPVVEDICSNLESFDYISKAVPAGSFRRGCETIGDLDILLETTNPRKAIDYFCGMEDVIRIALKGDTKARIELSENIMVDLRVIEKESFGAAMQYFTGSKAHNIHTRKIAISKGYKLSEYGLFKGKKCVASEKEIDIYHKLGLEWVPPELREDSGEIEAAREGDLPELVTIDDLKGDLHIHTNWSDGMNSIEEIVDKAKNLGYEYLAITDHGGNIPIAKGLNERKIQKQCKKIDKLNKEGEKKGWPYILKGSEVNIVDGGVDVSDSVLKKLDVVNAGLHHGLNDPNEVLMKRMKLAMENEFVHIIAHPTCRKLGIRKPTNLDMERIMDYAKSTGTMLEINAQPERMDLRDVDARNARKKTLLSISTDSHIDMQMDYMRYGISTARRGWCEKKHVLNSLDFKRLSKILDLG